MEDSNPELETFRQQWRAEVSARSRTDGNKGSNTGYSRQPRKSAFARLASTSGPKPSEDSDNHVQPQSFPGLDGSSKADEHDADSFKAGSSRQPRSALEHYEQAVERETQGNLGDSLDLYRKAFRVSSKGAPLFQV
jgi:F-box protein 9